MRSTSTELRGRESLLKLADQRVVTTWILDFCTMGDPNGLYVIKCLHSHEEHTSFSEKELVVSADGLKGPLDSSAVYQVWLIKGDQPVPAGAFKTDNKGEGTVTYALSEKEAGESWDTVAVTLEPKKDNKLPQGPVVLSAAF